jgi:hypothetical protein
MMHLPYSIPSLMNPSPCGRGCRQAGEGSFGVRHPTLAATLSVALRSHPHPNPSPEGRGALTPRKNPSPCGRECRQAGEGSVGVRRSTLATTLSVALRSHPHPNPSPEGRGALTPRKNPSPCGRECRQAGEGSFEVRSSTLAATLSVALRSHPHPNPSPEERGALTPRKNPSPCGRGCRQAGEGSVGVRRSTLATTLSVALRSHPHPNPSPAGRGAL